MKLQPPSEHPHGLSDKDFDALFTTDKPIIFAYHGYPWLIHRLTYRRTNHHNLHVRGYKEEGTTTTPFDMVVLNDLDRFHLVPGRHRSRAAAWAHAPPTLNQTIRDKLIEHKQLHSPDTARTCQRSATGAGPEGRRQHTPRDELLRTRRSPAGLSGVAHPGAERRGRRRCDRQVGIRRSRGARRKRALNGLIQSCFLHPPFLCPCVVMLCVVCRHEFVLLPAAPTGASSGSAHGW